MLAVLLTVENQKDMFVENSTIHYFSNTLSKVITQPQRCYMPLLLALPRLAKGL